MSLPLPGFSTSIRVEWLPSGKLGLALVKESVDAFFSILSTDHVSDPAGLEFHLSFQAIVKRSVKQCFDLSERLGGAVG